MGMTLAEYLFLAGGTSLLALFALRTIAPFMRSRLEKKAKKHASDLREEFLLLPPGKIMLLLIVSGAACSAFALVAIPDPLWAAAAGILPVLLSGFAVRFFRTRRRKKVISQMPGFLDILAGQIKAGHSMQEALSETIPLLPREIGKEISWVFRLCRLGTPLSEAFLLWEERLPCEEVALLVRPLRVALPAGGNIVDLLERTRDILRARNRMEEKMRSMTAQARLQAVVLTLLPPCFVFVLSKVDPVFLPRCLGTFQGKAILAGAGILQFLGWLAIRKILAVKP
ncbi:MAG: type II secretion system F family protein [Deltaproteobacteria bacterium]|nr:type II secretion system F family protein [Deltaproteobacteria bacterium]